MTRPKQDFGKSTNDNKIIRVGPLSLNKILSKIVCGCEGLSLRPPGYENCNQFYLLDCSQNSRAVCSGDSTISLADSPR